MRHPCCGSQCDHFSAVKQNRVLKPGGECVRTASYKRAPSCQVRNSRFRVWQCASRTFDHDRCAAADVAGMAIETLTSLILRCWTLTAERESMVAFCRVSSTVIFDACLDSMLYSMIGTRKKARSTAANLPAGPMCDLRDAQTLTICAVHHPEIWSTLTLINK